MSFLTLLQSQGTPSSQTITLNRVESTASVYAPTVVRQASKVVALSLVASTAQVFLPTVVQAGGVQTIALNRVESTAQIFRPTVYVPSNVTDNADILFAAKASKRKYKLTEKEEEEIAAQLLLKQRKPQKVEAKKAIDWKTLIFNAINGITNVEDLDALEVSTEGITSPSAVAALLAEVEKQKELKRIQLDILQQEAALKAIELKAQIDEAEAKIVAAITEQQAKLEQAKILQEQVLERHRIAQEQAEREEMEAYLQAVKAEQDYLEFKRKRDNKIKRIKALMWLAKLDI